MKIKKKILIVEDHPLIAEAYKNNLTSKKFEDYDFIIDIAKNCDRAIEKINDSAGHDKYDLLFLDIQLPEASDGKIISGEDLAVFAKKKLPDAKIIILTMYNENHRIHNILRTVNPDGLLVKDDITSEEFSIAFNAVVNNPPYYSSTVTKFFRNRAIRENLLDEVNRKILFYIAKGVKTKNLVKHIDLSLSAIQKRKMQIKDLFELENANDEQLIHEAKKRGFI